MTDKQLLEAWYHYASRATGFIGGALRTQRATSFQLQEQQRTLIGIGGKRYDDLWLRLQAMPLPRSDQFVVDLARIVAKVQENLEIVVDLNLERLEELIRAGLT